MNPVISHSWMLTEDAALQLQQELASKVVKTDQYDDIKFIAGVDVAYQKEGDKLVAAVVILDAESLEVIETVVAEDTVQFPYIPGLFSFRELPPLIKAFAKLKNTPDLVVCDGQGFAHPRRFGLACHLGVIFDVPTIGCGKTRLLGEAGEPDVERGSTSQLVDSGEIIGSVLRTQVGVKPIYVSIGHRVSLNTACEWVLKLAPKYRQPDTTRMADQVVRAELKKGSQV